MDRTGKTVRSEHSAKNLVFRVGQCLKNAKQKSYSTQLLSALVYTSCCEFTPRKQNNTHQSLTTQICIVNCHLLQHISALKMALIRYYNSKTPWGRILVYKHQAEYSVGLCIVNTYFVIFTTSTYTSWYLYKKKRHIRAKTHTYTHTHTKTDIYNQI